MYRLNISNPFLSIFILFPPSCKKNAVNSAFRQAVSPKNYYNIPIVQKKAFINYR